MKGSARSSVLILLLCLAAIAGLAVLGSLSAGPLGAVAPVALLAVVPMFAGALLTPLLTALVGVVALAAGVVVAVLPGTRPLNDYLIALGGIVLWSLVAVVVAAVRSRMTAAVVATASGAAAPAGPEGATGVVTADAEEAVEYPVVRTSPVEDTDALTGLLNRRAAIHALGRRTGESNRVLAFLDFDQFRQVNDTHGTAVGDEFLQAIAGRLRHSLPASDTVARWEGDEFLVVTACEADEALPALQRLSEALHGHPVRTAAGPIETSVSLGAAAWSSGQDLEDVITRAGRALHAAKAAGRGQVVLDEGA